MMTPMDYKARYEKIVVRLKNGKEQAVKVNMYRLRVMPEGTYGGYNQTAKQAFMAKLNKNGVDTEIRVDIDEGYLYLDPDLDPGQGSAFRMATDAGGALPLHGPSPSKNELPNDMATLAAYVFAGKGAPEHCQIVLQLAHQWDLAPDPQKYADDALGLDCNGFVGNYLWHAKRENDWRNLGLRNWDLGPDATIDAFFPFRPADFVTKWDDLDGTKMYVLGMVDGNGSIIKGGGDLAAAGHIMLTQPGFVRTPRTNGGVKSQAIQVVESTAGHKPGLWSSYYSLRTADTKNGIFNVLREEMTVPNLTVRIAELR